MDSASQKTPRIGLLRRIGRALKAWLATGKCCSSCDIPFMQTDEQRTPPKQTKSDG